MKGKIRIHTGKLEQTLRYQSNLKVQLKCTVFDPSNSEYTEYQMKNIIMG